MTLQCSKCGRSKPASEFNRSNTTKRGHAAYCRDCAREYRQEYILPALRGRGKARVMPAWVEDLIHKPKTLPGKLIRFEDYVDKVTGEVHSRAVVGGKR
jgi:NAD-dependent SIR2 family protein deacetylase